MEIKIIRQDIDNVALLGLGLSRRLTSNIDPGVTMNDDLYRKMRGIAKKLAFHSNGENKFLEQIIVSLLIRASIDWWKQFDTYRLVSKQSESTMNNMMKGVPIGLNDFESYVPVWLRLEEMAKINKLIAMNIGIDVLHGAIPGYVMEMRTVTLNYRELQTICHQREHHKLLSWQMFISFIRNEMYYPWYLFKDIEEEKC